jgi:hypothetical protein
VEGRDHTSGSSFIRTAEKDLELTGATTFDQDFIAHAPRRSSLDRGSDALAGVGAVMANTLLTSASSPHAVRARPEHNLSWWRMRALETPNISLDRTRTR